MKYFRNSIICTILAIIDITLLAILQRQKDLFLNYFSMEVFTMTKVILLIGIVILLGLIIKWVSEIFKILHKK